MKSEKARELKEEERDIIVKALEEFEERHGSSESDQTGSVIKLTAELREMKVVLEPLPGWHVETCDICSRPLLKIHDQ